MVPVGRKHSHTVHQGRRGRVSQLCPCSCQGICEVLGCGCMPGKGDRTCQSLRSPDHEKQQGCDKRGKRHGTWQHGRSSFEMYLSSPVKWSRASPGRRRVTLHSIEQPCYPGRGQDQRLCVPALLLVCRCSDDMLQWSLDRATRQTECRYCDSVWSCLLLSLFRPRSWRWPPQQPISPVEEPKWLRK
jgi:hypothetical protein